MNTAAANHSFLRTAGSPDREPIVFVHGFGDNGAVFAPLFSQSGGLAQSFWLIAVDLGGFGRTQRTHPATISNHAQSLATLIDCLSNRRRVGLVGHSVGSPICVDAARLLGSQISGLVSIEGNLTNDDSYFTGKVRQHTSPDDFKAAFLAEIQSLVKPQRAAAHYYSAVCSADPQAMWELAHDVLKRGHSTTFGEEFQALPVQKLLLWNPRNYSEQSVGWVQRGNIHAPVVETEGHWLMLEQPEAVSAEIQHFFNLQH